MRWVLIGVVLGMALARPALGQADNSATSCTFADGHQITVRYAAAGSKNQQPEDGEWDPNGSTMFLFTQTPVTLGTTQIPAGAYSLYLSGKKDWTLIVNRNTKPDAAYNQTMDLDRYPMQSGQISVPAKQIEVYFVHPQPKQCNLRVYYEKKGYWAEFKEP